MDARIDALGYVIEFSIGLAGFAGVVLVFQRESRVWGPLEIWRITNLLLSTLVPALLAFLAVAASAASLDEGTVWRSSCAAMVLTILLFHYRFWNARTKLSAGEQAHIAIKTLYAMQVPNLMILGASLAVVFDVWTRHGFLVFYLGLIQLLVTGAIQFARAILAARVRAGDAA